MTVYDPLYTSMYNVVFTSLPIMFVAIFEQDVTDEASLKFPVLYEAGPRNIYFNFMAFVHSMLRGFYHSLLLFYFLYIVMLGGGAINSDGEIQSDYYTFGMLLSAALTFIANLQLGLEIRYWTWLVAVSMIVGPFGYLLLTALEYETESPYGDGIEFISAYFNTYDRCFSGSMFWMYFSLVIVLTVLPELLIQLFSEYVLYTPVHQVREYYLLNKAGCFWRLFHGNDVKQVKQQNDAAEIADAEAAHQDHQAKLAAKAKRESRRESQTNSLSGLVSPGGAPVEHISYI